MSAATPSVPAERAGMGLLAVFGSTFIELVGYFMLSPMLLLRLKNADVSTTLAGLYVATGWLGIFLMTPFASSVANRIGQRPCMWTAGTLLTLCAVVYALTQQLWIWFVLNLLSGIAMSLRWVLAEALIAEFCPPHRRGRYVGLFQTLVSATFIIGPATMAWLGPYNPRTIQLVIALTLAGLAWTFLIPPVPSAHDAQSARVGVHGLLHALRAHPIIMLAGFVGGFFETGVTSILPLYGLSLHMAPGAAAGLVAISGLGGMLMMIPAGLLADRYQDQAHGRRQLMLYSAAAMLLASSALPWVMQTPWLCGPVVFLWGGAGASLYGLSMTDIGSREKGITLVNSTAVLVLTYTLGGLIASALSAALIDWSPEVAFPAALLLVSALGLWALLRNRSLR